MQHARDYEEVSRGAHGRATQTCMLRNIFPEGRGCSITPQDEQEFPTQGWGARKGHRGRICIAVAVRLRHAKAQRRGGTAHL